jgi:tRNA G37 N-methylase TrmD
MGWKVPAVLVSGDHKKIEEWKKKWLKDWLILFKQKKVKKKNFIHTPSAWRNTKYNVFSPLWSRRAYNQRIF